MSYARGGGRTVFGGGEVALRAAPLPPHYQFSDSPDPIIPCYSPPLQPPASLAAARLSASPALRRSEGADLHSGGAADLVHYKGHIAGWVKGVSRSLSFKRERGKKPLPHRSPSLFLHLALTAPSLSAQPRGGEYEGEGMWGGGRASKWG